MLNQNENSADILATLGVIYGVSQLAVKESLESKANSNVLVAEKAFVFLAWELNNDKNDKRGN